MANDLVRITGMNSGLDTESIIKAYTSTQSSRVTKAKNKLTLNNWTQDAWQGLNTKIYSFYSNTLSTNRMSSAYAKKKVTTSNDALSVIPGTNATKGTQSAKIIATASSAYLTGGKIAASSASDSLTEKLGLKDGDTLTFEGADGSTKQIQIGGEAASDDITVVNTMDELVNAFRNCGVNANFDAGNQRLFLSAKESGEAGNFEIKSDDASVLAKLGLASKEQLTALGMSELGAASKIKGTNAKLELNGAEFESNTNSFNINGSTYTINHMPADPDQEISVSTTTDYESVYNVVKDMLKEFNSLINEMSKLYNADSAKGYDPLTDEQRENMSEKEITEWEDKIKGALLRKDETLGGVMNVMTDIINQGFEVNGKKMYLADFGISTLGYFEADENERYALHIDGDSADGVTSGKEDKLKAMIASDPEAVTDFFTSFAGELYKSLYSKMGSSTYSSIYKVYNDKQLKSDNSELKTKIAELEDQLKAREDKYYKLFSRMETNLASINSKQSSLTGFFSN